MNSVASPRHAQRITVRHSIELIGVRYWNRFGKPLIRAWKKSRYHLRQLGYVRLAFVIMLLLLSILLARYSWYLPLAVDVERALFDIRTAVTAPHVEQDPRITLITYTDETLFATGIRSPVDRTVLEKSLSNINAMGAKAIGIDIVFDSPRPEDSQLKAQLSAMQTPTWLAYIEHSDSPNTIQYQQHQFLTSFLDDIGGVKTRPASVWLQNDPDGRIRRWPAPRTDSRPSFVAALAAQEPTATTLIGRIAEDYQGSIRFRLPRRADSGSSEPVFAKIPIDIFAAPMNADSFAALQDFVRGRYILIGGDIIDRDRFDTPISGLMGGKLGDYTAMIGLEVHAHMLAQKLDNDWMAMLPTPVLWGMAIIAVTIGGLAGLIDVRPRWLIPLAVGQITMFGGLPFYLHAEGYDTLSLPAFGWISGWIGGYAVVANAARIIGGRQRAFAQSALGKYLPRNVATQIIENPERLALHGEKREVFSLFTDMEGFTSLSHNLPPEKVAHLLNPYLDCLSDIILDYGGTIDKFMGDGIMAFWGAPIRYDDDGKRAAAAALALYQAGESFRHAMAEDIPNIGMTRVGLHAGEAIVGNFGGQKRIQYTALGDSINTAARLEQANKILGTRVLLSREAVAQCDRTDMLALGRISVRGRAQPIDIFEPRPDLDPAIRTQINHMVAAHYSHNRQISQTIAAGLSAAVCADSAIDNLLNRLKSENKLEDENHQQNARQDGDKDGGDTEIENSDLRHQQPNHREHENILS